MKVSISEIARRCGVSKATISYIANNKQTAIRISPATVERAKQAMQEAGWQPDAEAVSLGLKKRSICRVAFFSPWVAVHSSWFSIETCRAVRDEEGDCTTTLYPYSPGGLASAIKSSGAFSKRFDVLLVAGTNHQDDKFLEALKPDDRRRVLLLNRALEGFAGVSGDDVAGGRLLAEAAVSAAHYERFVLCHFDTSASQVRATRSKAITETLKGHGIKIEQWAGDPAKEPGAQADEALTRFGTDRVLYFTPLDSLGAEFLHAARRLHIQVPKEIGITGWDREPVSRWVQPDLLTVDTHLYEMTKQAFDLARRMKTGDTVSPICVTPCLVRGGSVIHLDSFTNNNEWKKEHT